MDAFINFPPNSGIERDVLEDELEAALGEVGKVTGTGSGISGSNLDLLIDDRVPHDRVLQILVSVLQRNAVAQARIVIDGKEHPYK